MGVYYAVCSFEIMFVIRADILVDDIAYSITREAFAQFRELKNKDRAKPFSDSVLLDKLGRVLSKIRLDHVTDPECYLIDGLPCPLLYYISRTCEYHLAIVKARYSTLVGIKAYEKSDEYVNPIVHEIDFHGEIIGITNHALDRFVTRWIQFERDLPKEPLKYLAKILNQAVSDELSPVLRVLRLINSGAVPAIYLRHGPWRMVILDQGIGGNTTKTLLTFERRIRL